MAFHTNNEGEMCEMIHTAHEDDAAALIINAGAWTHYSCGIRDALAILNVPPVIEVHMSNIHAREEFRRHSVISEVSAGKIYGFGMHSY